MIIFLIYYKNGQQLKKQIILKKKLEEREKIIKQNELKNKRISLGKLIGKFSVDLKISLRMIIF